MFISNTHTARSSTRKVSHVRLFWLWKLQFWLERSWLHMGLGKRILGVEHVGSTSIPGMPAKPIVDISIAVEDYDRAWWIVPAMKCLGYVYLGENPDLKEYAFERRGLFPSAVFVCEPEGEKWRARSRFRDYLIGHPEERRAYVQLKQALARQFADDCAPRRLIEKGGRRAVLYER